MKRFTIFGIILICFAALCFGQRRPRDTSRRARSAPKKIIQLTEPKLTGTMSFEEALANRRNIRVFTSEKLQFPQIGQLAWAGQGVTESQGERSTILSTEGFNLLELYFATEEGLFKYRPKEHTFEQTYDQDIRSELSLATSMQETVSTAGCDIIVAGNIRRLASRMRTRARTYTTLEAGYTTQNILLQAVSMDLGATKIIDFNSKDVGRICRISRGLEPICIISVGYPTNQGDTETRQDAKNKRAVFIVPSENFSDEELFETKRVLDAAGVQTVIASTRIGMITGSQNIAEANIIIGRVSVEDYDAIIFIGGMGVIEYAANPVVLNLAREAVRQGKVLAAIGIAPSILANSGVLGGIRATSYISERAGLITAGALYSGIPLEEDRSIITASGPAASIQFGRAIADALGGK
ncbi:MAG: DJ-1/PfpI family protein [Phycisphaerales bacterium]